LTTSPQRPVFQNTNAISTIAFKFPVQFLPLPLNINQTMAQVKKSSCSFFAHRLALARKQTDHTVEPPVTTTSPQRPVFQNTKSFLVKSPYYLESLVSDHFL